MNINMDNKIFFDIKEVRFNGYKIHLDNVVEMDDNLRYVKYYVLDEDGNLVKDEEDSPILATRFGDVYIDAEQVMDEDDLADSLFFGD